VNGRVYVVTKIKETIEGYLIPYEDLKCLDTHYSVLSLFKNENFKEGIFIMNIRLVWIGVKIRDGKCSFLSE
jgi:hypothetical protein